MAYLFLLMLEIIVLYILMRKASNRIFNIVRNHYIYAVLFLPGTFVHEMSHFLTALFLLVPVGQIELMPKVVEGGIKMGSVPIGKTDPIRRTLIGISPVIFGIIIIYVTTILNLPLLVHAYIAFEVGNSMFSSKKDLEGVIPVFIITAILVILLYLIGVRINTNFDFGIFQKIDLFLIIPIAIDLVLSL